MEALYTAIREFGFPVVVCVYLLYTLNYRLETVRKSMIDKMDGIIANQIKIISDLAAIRAIREDDEGGRGRAK